MPANAQRNFRRLLRHPAVDECDIDLLNFPFLKGTAQIAA